jgi:hypothetical protein
VYTGATRPQTPGIDVVAPAGTPRSGTFGAGFEGGNAAVEQQFGLLPMTVQALASGSEPAPTAPTTPTPTTSVPVNPTPTPTAPVVAPSVPAAGTWEPLGPQEIVFGAASEWKRDIRTAPVAGNSPALVSNLARQVAEVYGGWAASNIYRFNTSYHVVGPGVRRITVKFFDCQNKGYTPAELYTPAAGAIFAGVPFPDDAKIAPGTDAQVTIYDPTSDQLWEFWQTQKRADGWYACWGGRIDQVSKNKGVYPGMTGVAPPACPTPVAASASRKPAPAASTTPWPCRSASPATGPSSATPPSAATAGTPHQHQQHPEGTRFRSTPPWTSTASACTRSPPWSPAPLSSTASSSPTPPAPSPSSERAAKAPRPAPAPTPGTACSTAPPTTASWPASPGTSSKPSLRLRQALTARPTQQGSCDIGHVEDLPSTCPTRVRYQ